MLYNFLCKQCGHNQTAMFSVNNYDDYVVYGGDNDGLLKNTQCEKCGSEQLFRHINRAPGVMGGTTGYMSMERYMEKNKGNTRRLQDQLDSKLNERYRKKVLENIDKQKRAPKNDKNLD